MTEKTQLRKKKSFIRQDIHKKKRLTKKWRKPRGCDSKKRLRKQNHVIVSPGYGSPKLFKHSHYSGLSIVNISSVKEIDSLDSKTQGAIVSGKIGFKNQKKVIQELLKKKIRILNIANPEKYLEIKENKLKDKRKKKEDKDKDKKKEDDKKKEKKSIDDKITDEDKKKTEKKEIDKLLTKRA